MDSEEARTQAAQVHQAYHAASRPPIPLTANLTAAVFAAVGVALLGQPAANGWQRAALLACAIVVLGFAYLIPTFVRKRQGLFGYKGHVRRDNTVYLIVVVSLMISGLNATPVLGAIYVALGAIAGVAYFFALRGWGLPK